MSVQAENSFTVPPVMSQFALVSAFIKNAFLNMLAYRLRYYTGIVTYVLFVSVHYFIWKAVFAAKAPGETINGFTLQEMITYIAVGWIARSLYFSNIDETIDDLVRTGQVGVYLLRPVNFQMMMLATAVGESLFRACFFSLPIGFAIWYFFPIDPPASAIDLLMFFVATALGFFVFAALNFILGMAAFWFASIDGLTRAKYYIVQLFSGLLLPVTFFPPWLRTISHCLPFETIAYVPLKFYLGKVPPDAIGVTLLPVILWCVALTIVGLLCWKKAFAKLSIQGG